MKLVDKPIPPENKNRALAEKEFNAFIKSGGTYAEVENLSSYYTTRKWYKHFIRRYDNDETEVILHRIKGKTYLELVKINANAPNSNDN